MRKIDQNKKKKQDALLNTAYDLFTNKGFKNTSISEIVKEAGVAKGTFYLYFRDKTDIRQRLICKKSAQVLRDAYDRMIKENLDNVDDQIIFVVDDVLGNLDKNHMLLKFISKYLGWGMFRESMDEPAAELQENIYQEFLHLLTESGNEYRSPEIMLFMIIELVSSCAYNSIIRHAPADLDEVKPYLYRTIRSLLDANIVPNKEEKCGIIEDTKA